MRGLLVFGFALYVALATGNTPVLGAVCAQQCADDDADGHCAPTCSDCACCSHVSAITIPRQPSPHVVAVADRMPERTAVTPPQPSPHEILHVPIA